MKKSEFRIVVKTFTGLEGVLAQELGTLGASEIEVHTRSVSCKGSLKTLYKINYCCRTALRVLVPIFEYKATDQSQLYQGAYNIDWQQYMTVDQTFAINSDTNGSAFDNTMFVSVKVKDAIADQFRDRVGKRPSINKDFPHIRINVHIYKDKCTISLDSSGDSLHKRGYRSDVVKAPIKEVLAAGLILLTGWNGDSTFIDGMCGSGTFLAEAGMIAKNIPANYFRKDFGFEQWKNFDRNLWEEVILEGEQGIRPLACKIIGTDSAKSAVKIARENIKEAQLKNEVDVRSGSFEDMEVPEGGGIVILNPPYGERFDKDLDIMALYKGIGDTLKQKFNGYDAWVISSNMAALKNIGLKSSRKLVVFNGQLESRFIKYELYKGSKRIKDNEHV